MPHIPELYRKFEPRNPKEIGENMHSCLEGGFRTWLHLEEQPQAREKLHYVTQVAAADLKELPWNHKHFGTLDLANLAWSTAVPTLDKKK